MFANLVSRFLLFITAWTATARENQMRVVEPPPPTVVRPNVTVRKGAGMGAAVEAWASWPRERAVLPARRPGRFGRPMCASGRRAQHGKATSAGRVACSEEKGRAGGFGADESRRMETRA